MKDTKRDSSVIHSILFPRTGYNASISSSNAVPETPSPGIFIHSRARFNNDVVSVMETPDNTVNIENDSKEFDEVPPLIGRRKPSLLPRLPSEDSEDDSFLDIIPDLDLCKKKKKSSNKEAEQSVNSDLETQMIEDGNHGEGENSESNHLSQRKSRRRSILETLTPFDLNDDDLISKKIHCYKNSDNKPKRRSLSCGRSPLSVRKCASSTPGTGRRKSVSFSVSCSMMSPNITPKRNSIHAKDANAQFGIVPVTPKRDKRRTLLFESDNMALTPVLKKSQILVRQPFRNHSGDQSPRIHNFQDLTEKSSSVDQGILSFQNFSTPSHKLHSPTPRRQSGTCNTMISVYEEDKWDQCAVATQPAASVVLEDVVAYVDVRIGNDNRSQAVKEQLLSLGAQIRNKLTSDVTHVIFRDGARGCFNKAKKKGLHIVSSLWVEACRENLAKASEALYPSTSTEKYQSPALPHRLRKLKSMQPREFHEEEQLAENRLRKRMKTQECDSPNLELPNLFSTPARNLEAKNSPLYGISHLLSSKQKHMNPDANEYNKEDMLGSQALNLEKSLAQRLYDRYVKPSNMEDVPPGHQLPIPEDQQTSDIQVTAISYACSTLSLQGQQFNKENAEEEERLSSCHIKPMEKLLVGTKNNKKHVQERRQSVRLKKLNVNSKFISEEPECQSSICSKELNYSEANDSSGSSSSSLQLALSENCDEDDPTNNKDYKLENKNSKVLGSITSKEQVISDEEVIERKLGVRKESCKSLEETSILDLSNYQTKKFQSVYTQGSQYASRSPGGTRKLKRRLISIDNSRLPSEDLIIPSSPMQVSNLRQPYADLMINSSKTQKRTTTSPRLSLFGNHPNLCMYTSTPVKTNVKGRGRRRNAFPQSPKRKTSSQRKPAPRKIKITNSLSEEDDDELFINSSSNHFTVLPHPRRSTDEFQTVNNVLTSKSRKKSPGVICITSFHSKECCSAISIIKKLGGFKVVDTVDAFTSHIVCGAERRTMNVLNGIARGCWILDVSWVYHSLEMDTWVSEEPFEMFTFCPGAKVNREKRALQGRNYKNSLFSSAGNIYVTDNCTPPASELKELLELCGANLVKSTRSANIIVGKGAIGIDGKVKHLQEKWILDSIQKHNVESVTTYLVT